MTPDSTPASLARWAWWAGAIGEDCYEIVSEARTRDDCIRQACRELAPGDTFQIVEAQLSQAARYEGADFVPFIRQRNHETLTVGPREHKDRPND